jgi:hypothetical protein
MKPELAPTLEPIEARLRQRFPAAAAVFVHACVEEAARNCADARVRNFLAILIERRAAEALAASHRRQPATSSDGAPASTALTPDPVADIGPTALAQPPPARGVVTGHRRDRHRHEHHGRTGRDA